MSFTAAGCTLVFVYLPIVVATGRQTRWPPDLKSHVQPVVGVTTPAAPVAVCQWVQHSRLSSGTLKSQAV